MAKIKGLRLWLVASCLPLPYNLNEDKHVESSSVPRLDEGSIPSSSTFNGVFLLQNKLKDIDNLIDCWCLFLFLQPAIRSIVHRVAIGMTAFRSSCLRYFTNASQASSTSVSVLTLATRLSMSSFLLLNCILAPTALAILTSISIFLQLLSW